MISALASLVTFTLAAVQTGNSENLQDTLLLHKQMLRGAEKTREEEENYLLNHQNRDWATWPLNRRKIEQVKISFGTPNHLGKLQQGSETVDIQPTSPIEDGESEESKEGDKDDSGFSEGAPSGGKSSFDKEEEDQETIEPAWCDEYGCHRDPYHVDERNATISYNYEKSMLHGMVWGSLFQLAVPTTAFTLLETKAWDDYKAPSNMLSIPPYLTTKRSDRMHYTKEVKAWEKIMTANAFVWGPMFLMGLFALSDLLRQTTARYIQHMLSNWMLPATLYSYYLLLDVSIDTGKAAEYFKFAGFFLVSFISVAGFYTEGTNAMYFLLDGKSKYADPELVPSLFYLLNWSEHTERTYYQQETYGGYEYYD